MANLNENAVIVDRPRNESRTGDSGTRARKPASAYLLVGGSKFDYSVTVNFETGHACKADHSGKVCPDNTFNKKRAHGPIHLRDTSNPAEWCKHIKAALADTEAVAEAQEITAETFGLRKRTPAPAPAPEKAEDSKADRLAALEAEKAALLAEIAAEEQTAELREGIKALIEKHGAEAVRAAVKAA